MLTHSIAGILSGAFSLTGAAGAVAGTVAGTAADASGLVTFAAVARRSGLLAVVVVCLLCPLPLVVTVTGRSTCARPNRETVFCNDCSVAWLFVRGKAAPSAKSLISPLA